MIPLMSKVVYKGQPYQVRAISRQTPPLYDLALLDGKPVGKDTFMVLRVTDKVLVMA